MNTFECHFYLKLGQFSLEVKLYSHATVLGLFGNSGTGKSSILHALAGIHTPQSGHIRIAGQTWFDTQHQINISIQHRRTGLVFQDAQLFPHKSVLENLLYGYRNIAPHERQFIPDDIIQLLKLEHLLKRMPNKLSGGEKQRVALGRALLYSPCLLLFDEPLSALDNAHKAEILPFFQTVISQTNIPMLYVSHDKAEIDKLTSEIYYL